MRLFTGIQLPESILERLERLLVHLRASAHLKWSPSYNFHITTKFIGEWPQEKLPQLQEALGKLPQRPPVVIKVNGLGWLPTPHSPHVFFAAVHGGAPLNNLFSDIDNALETLGVARDSKAFSPHITLARIKQPTPLQAIRQTIAELESADFGSFEAPEFHLFSSKTGAAGSVYTKLSSFLFTE